MKKIVIFTEGRGELIFIRHLLLQVIGYECVSFKCFNLVADKLYETAYVQEQPNASLHYLIINVGTDERVLSAINTYYEGYVAKGYEIVGIRDMYSASYKKKSSTTIDPQVNNYFYRLVQEYIQHLAHPDKIHFFFSVMELETWFLGLCRSLERINPLLSIENIRNSLGIDLLAADPETTFFHPASIFKQVLHLGGINYDKHISDVESIVSKITLDDIEKLVKSNHCSSFRLLYQEIEKEFYDSLSD